MNMTLIHARLIAEYRGAFSSELVLDAYLLLRGARTHRPAPVVIRGDPDAKLDLAQNDGEDADILKFELEMRHKRGASSK